MSELSYEEEVRLGRGSSRNIKGKCLGVGRAGIC